MPSKLESRHFRPPEMPQISSDEIFFSPDDAEKLHPLTVKIHYFVKDEEGWIEKTETIVIPTLIQPLADFVYRKPIENPSNPWGEPLEIRPDATPRSGYFAISTGLVGRRPPNHLFEDCEFLITFTNFGTTENPDWQTRYFPKSYLPAITWEEAQKAVQK